MAGLIGHDGVKVAYKLELSAIPGLHMSLGASVDNRIIN